MTTHSNTLDGRIAIVTGAASPIGMGRSITTGFVRAGARVAMLDVNEDWLEQSANDLREIGGDDAVMPIVVDVTSPESVQNAVQRTISEMGGLHILVNNAGINARTGGFGTGEAGSQNPYWTLPPDAWLRVIDVNLSGPFLMSHAVAPHMMSRDSVASSASPPAWTPCGARAARPTAHPRPATRPWWPSWPRTWRGPESPPTC